MNHHNIPLNTTTWNSSSISSLYKERIAYDANGNILKYLRDGHSPQAMDSLTYKYNRDANGRLLNNRLEYVRDAVAAGNYTEDIDNQPAGNYTYDKIGNLKTDQAESITSIDWTVYGKIRGIVKSGTGAPVISYGYDPGGNRTSKLVISGANTDRTYYVRDAQGNTLAVYSKHNSEGIKWNEQHLYGSSRLGMWNWDTLVPGAAPVVGSGSDHLYDSVRLGARQYELSNHLGNVLSVISDKKLGNDSSGVVNYYIAEVLSQKDYYPFGMGMVGRKYDVAGAYRYGFNGQEKTPEVGGDGYTAEFWQYDARLGRRWNVDPITKSYESAYAVLGNSPLSNIDPNGADTVNITRTMRREVAPKRGSNLDNYPSTKILDNITYTGQIDIAKSDGPDVFQITDVDILVGLDGKETWTSTTTTLELSSKISGYSKGGRNMKGYIDDRFALAANAPTWLLKLYEEKSGGDIGIRSAIAYQKDVPFVAALHKISNAAYLITGAYAVVRMTLAATVPVTMEEGGFFAGTRYTSKVFKQMNSDYYHGFPESVKAFENYGIRSTIVGGDGVKREMLRIPGLYGEKGGFFEFIKEADGAINHRVFMPLVR